MKHYKFIISDFEHAGDLAWARQQLKQDFPNVTNIKTYEEEDFEAEFEYREDYGEEDFEPIYRGYIEFDAPDEYAQNLKDYSL